MKQLFILFHHLKLILIGTENFTFLLQNFTITRATTVEANIQNKMLMHLMLQYYLYFPVENYNSLWHSKKKKVYSLHFFHSCSIPSL